MIFLTSIAWTSSMTFIPTTSYTTALSAIALTGLSVFMLTLNIMLLCMLDLYILLLYMLTLFIISLSMLPQSTCFNN
uniref:NADH dehydrogenase subunit 6 n=1 Tax=Meloidogyne incognita TaxID=6306 RepID=A0A914M3G4_MELIC